MNRTRATASGPPSAGREDRDTDRPGRGATGRGVALALLLGGIACLFGALLVSGGVAAVLLDALEDASATGAGDCMGAMILPALLLLASAMSGLIGLVLSSVGAYLLWHLAGRAGAGGRDSANLAPPRRVAPSPPTITPEVPPR